MSRHIRVLAAAGAAALSLGLASAGTLIPMTPAASTTGIGVFVGYADTIRARGAFPNPWNGTPNVTFDGCTPAAACIFDAGSIRVENDNTTSVVVDQVSVHIGACLYTWDGPLYPVTLAPRASLIATQRAPAAAAGCAGPTPSTFDSSDIPAEGMCTNDGILPTVDVTVDGVTSSATDTGQVLNSGGIDPGICTNTNESTEWVPIGSKACPGQTLTLDPPSQTDSVGGTATVTATFTNACGSPLSGVLTAFKVAAGPNAGMTGSGITDPAGNASFGYSSLLVGTDTLEATITNAVGFTTTSNTAAVTWIVAYAPGGGSFVVGNQNASAGDSVYFWGAQWSKQNSLSGGPAPRSFKGFAEEPATPGCGGSWTADPGNSTPPPDGPLPAFMAVIVTSAAQQSGSNITGDIVEIVIVKTSSGFEPNPGHRATGIVVAVLCGGPSSSPAASSATSPGNPSGSISEPDANGVGGRPTGGHRPHHDPVNRKNPGN